MRHSVGLYSRTLRHLRPIQIGGRLLYRLRKPKPDLAPAPEARTSLGVWVLPAARRQSLFEGNRFSFLNVDASLEDIGWDDPSLDKLWRYNQHYFDDLNAAGASERRDLHEELIARWQSENLPAAGTGWEPYPTSLRIVNWVKWALGGGELDGAARHSLAVQTRWLTQRIEWHILGNHLFSNAKALIHAGFYFGGDEGDRWRALGFSILRDQLEEQILPDGGQFERSPMYHALAVEDVLDLVNLMREYQEHVPPDDRDLLDSLEQRVPAMLRWLAIMSHPDGEIAFFNDAAMEIAPANDVLIAYAERLGFRNSGPPPGVVHFQSSGYVRLQQGSAALLIDAAPVGPDYLPGHGHADTLSFELSIGSQRLIVNSGTSVYGSSAERLRQRGTAAHSTLMLDGKDSSEVWSGFRVGRRARILQTVIEDRSDRAAVIAAHDGYAHLPGAPVHERRWNLARGRLLISDIVTGSGSHKAAILFHFPSSIRPEMSDRGGTVTLLSTAGQHVADLIMSPDAAMSFVETSWHPKFGVTEPSFCLQIEVSGPMPLHHETTIHWNDK